MAIDTEQIQQLCDILEQFPNFGTLRTDLTKVMTTMASTTENGLMTTGYVNKLNSISEGANKTVTDGALSSTSTNPIQTKVVNAAIEDLQSKITSGDAESATLANTMLSSIELTSAGISTDSTGINEKKYTNTYTFKFLRGNGDVAGTFDISDIFYQYSIATESKAGLISAADQAKLNSISSGANAYVLPTAGGTLGGVKTTSTVTDVTDYTPVPIVNGIPYYKDTNTTYGIATSSVAGLVKSGTDITVDGSGNVSVNDNSHKHTVSNITDFPSSMPASDVYAWAKASTKPTYTASEVGADPTGSASSALSSAKSYTDTKLAELVGSASETMDTLEELADAIANNKSVIDAINTSITTKADASDLTSHLNNKNNPHGVTKAQVGLGNVDNTADSAKNVLSATKWTTARTLSLTGAITGSVSIDGSGNVSMTTTEGNVSFKRMGTIIGDTTDWNIITTPGMYTVSMASWGDTSTYHSPNSFNSTLYSYGILLVFMSNDTTYSAITQIYIPHSSTAGFNATVVVRQSFNGTETRWNGWRPMYYGITKSYIGLGNVENKSSATIRGELTKDNVTTALGYTPPSSVSFTRSLTSGTKIGTLNISGSPVDLYAPTDTDTHYTTKLIVGASATATANAAATNGNVYMNVLDNSTVRNAHKITGAKGVSVTSDANGHVTITGTTYPVYGKTLSDGFTTAYRTQTKGDANAGDYISTIRNDSANADSEYSGQYGTGLAWGRADTHGYLYMHRNDNVAYIGAGNKNQLNWVKQIAFIDSNVASANKLATARTISLAGSVTGSGTFDGSGNLSITTSTNHDHMRLKSRANTRLTSANFASSSNRVNTLEYFLATSSMTEGKPMTDGYIIHMNWDSTDGWDSQLFIPSYNSSVAMQYRYMNKGTWGSWRTLLDSANYTSYTVTKTGSGASGSWGISVTGSSASCTGNAATATKATQDSAGQQINTTYIKALSVSGKVITYTKGDGTTGTLTTQDTNTTYSTMTGATTSAAGTAGLVPAPAAGKNTAFLRGDGTWAIPTNTDTLVTQTNTTSAADYRLILSYNANDTTETQSARKSGNFLANPSTGEFYAKGYRRIDITGQTCDINTLNLSSGSPQIMRYICKTDGGSLNMTNIPVTSNSFILDVELIRYIDSTDYITKQTFVSRHNPYSTHVRYCTNGTWKSWVQRIYTDTHYTTSLIVGASATATANAAATNGNVYMNVLDNSTVRNAHNIVGTGATTVTSDANGKITIYSENTKYTAGTGLSLSGTTFNHSNSVTAGTAQGDANKTLTFGGTFTIPTVTYDAQGHVTGKGTTTMTMPANPNTDTKVTNTLATTTKAYLTGTTSTTTNTGTQVFDTGVYVTTTAGQLNATSYKVSEKVTLQYDSTEECLNFVFS